MTTVDYVNRNAQREKKTTLTNKQTSANNIN